MTQLMKKLSNKQIRETWSDLIVCHPHYQRMPNLGLVHLQRANTMEDGSILVTYLTPDRQTVLHNETTREEMLDQGVTALEALETSIRVMDKLHGGKCPGAFLQITLNDDQAIVDAMWERWERQWRT